MQPRFREALTGLSVLPETFHFDGFRVQWNRENTQYFSASFRTCSTSLLVSRVTAPMQDCGSVNEEDVHGLLSGVGGKFTRSYVD